MITTTDPGGLVKIVTLTKHENIQTDQQQQRQFLGGKRSKIGQICQWIVVKKLPTEGGRGQKS